MIEIVTTKESLDSCNAFIHIENYLRISNILLLLKEKNIPYHYARSYDENVLQTTHSKQYVEKIRLLSSNNAGLILDNFFCKHTYEMAKQAAFSAITAATISKKEGCFTFSLARPPGHHAYKNSFSGFCFFNNIAVACNYLLSKKLANKILIVDLDLHYGDGTHSIFLNNKDVFYFSIHQSTSFTFPFKEFKSNNSLTINLSLSTTYKQYLSLFEKSLEKINKTFSYDFVAVSMGFDTWYKDNSTVGNMLSITNPKFYEKLSSKLLEKTQTKNMFFVLEGGYSTDDLPVLFYNFIQPLL